MQSLLALSGIEFTRLGAAYVVIAAVTYFSLLFAGKLLKRRGGVHLGRLYQIFAVFAAVFVPTLIPHIDLSIERELGALTALAGAFVAISFVRKYFWEALFPKGDPRRPPELLGQLLSILIVVVTILCILNFAYGIKIPGLLAGSGIIAVILGLAMQDMLGNIFAGFAIYFGKPFSVGDWLLIEQHHAEVMEINWRSVRLRTNDHVYLDVPNNAITKQTIVNYHYPSATHSNRLHVGIEYSAAPTLVKSVLADAAANARHVLRDPAPVVHVKQFSDFRMVYEIQYWLNDHAHLVRAESSIRSNIWYALRRHGIKIPFPIEVQYHRADEPPANDYPIIRHALAKLPFAKSLDEMQLALLHQHARLLEFGAGEKITEQDAQDDHSMYVLISGRADVLVHTAEEDRHVATVNAGDCVGEMSLLTGEQRSATVLAVEDCRAVQIDREAMAELISKSPGVLEVLSDMLAQRRLQNDGILATNARDQAARRREYSAGFFRTLKRLFEI